MPGFLIILGASARAAAQSARRAGYEPWCADLFCDRDLARIATARRCPAKEYPAGLLRLLETAPAEAPVLLTGALENYPELLRAIAFERELLGSTPEAIERVRDPLALPSLPTTTGLRFCKTSTGGSLGQRLSQLVFGSTGVNPYLLKPRRSAGGVHIRWWQPGQSVGEDFYIQQYVRGTPHSAVFFADGWSATLLGVSEQLVGSAMLGAEGFRYCGSLGPVSMSERQRAALSHLAVQLTQRYDVRGIFGVDFIIDGRERIWPVEVNPRYTACIEVLERAFRLPLLARLGDQSTERHARQSHQWHGKGIVFARRDVRVDDLYERFAEHEIADVPAVGARVRVGRPICTVFAAEASRAACHEALAEQARRLYAHVEAGVVSDA